MAVDWELLARVAAAMAAGTLVGFERELRGHPAGIRTHALVATGAAMFTIAGFIQAFGVDQSRVASQVVSGIGFIGAGAIIRDRVDIRGITTATTIWVAGAIGVGYGTGNFVLTTFGALVVMFVLVVLRPLRGQVAGRLAQVRAEIDLRYEQGHGTLGPVMGAVEAADASILDLTIDDEKRAGQPPLRRVRLHVRVHATRLDELKRRVAEATDRTEIQDATFRDTAEA